MDRGVSEQLPGWHSLKWYRRLTYSTSMLHGTERSSIHLPPCSAGLSTVSLSSRHVLDFILGTSVEDQLEDSP